MDSPAWGGTGATGGARGRVPCSARPGGTLSCWALPGRFPCSGARGAECASRGALERAGTKRKPKGEEERW